MGKFISAAHTSDFLITQITWYMIVSPWWELAPPSVAMALSWETEGWAAPSRLREGSCSKLWGIQVSWDLTHKWWEGAASAVIYVLHQTFTVEWAEHQSKAVDGAPIFAPSWSGDLRVLQGLNGSSFIPWICTNFFLVLRERKPSDTPDAPWGSCCSELLVYIDN